MKSKGPVDFLLGIFLELGAALCVLFFLGDIPWQHWTIGVRSNQPQFTSADQTDTGRQISFRPLEKLPSLSAPSQPSPRPPAPALLAADNLVMELPASPLATSAPPRLRREFPRSYRY